jgi:hypothetical protein
MTQTPQVRPQVDHRSTRAASAPPARSTTPTAGARGTSSWVGWIAFASLLMLGVGLMHVVQGLVALFDRSYFVVPSRSVVLDLGYTTWGWLHLLAGLVVAAAGVCVLAGTVWARAVGTVVAMLSAVGSLLFVAAHPAWSVLIIAVDVMVILALTVHGSEIKAGS